MNDTTLEVNDLLGQYREALAEANHALVFARAMVVVKDREIEALQSALAQKEEHVCPSLSPTSPSPAN